MEMRINQSSGGANIQEKEALCTEVHMWQRMVPGERERQIACTLASGHVYNESTMTYRKNR